MNLLKKIIKSYVKNNRNEVKISFGNKHKNKIFFVIRRDDLNAGLFSVINTNLAYVAYAMEKEYIPIIDMTNYSIKYNCQEENVWEFYFEQPFSYSMKDIYKAKNVIFSNMDPLECKYRPNTSKAFLDDAEKIAYWRNVYKKYLKIPDAIMKEMEEERLSLIHDDRVIGVLARGTDYLALKPKGHPIQPDLEMLIKKTEEVMKEYHCNKVFVATEDVRFAQEFQIHFGDAYIASAREYIQYDGKDYLSQYSLERNNDKFLRDKEYLTNIYILSKCTCFVAGRTSGSIGALLMSEGYEYTYFFDLGTY